MLLLSISGAPYVYPCDTTDTGKLYVLRDTLGVTGAARGDTWEDAYSAALDTVRPDASPSEILDAAEGEGRTARRVLGWRQPRRRFWDRLEEPEGSKRAARALGRYMERRAALGKDLLPEGYHLRDGLPTPESAKRRAELERRFGKGRVYAARVSPFACEDLNGERLELLTRELAEELRVRVQLEEGEILDAYGEPATLSHGTARAVDLVGAYAGFLEELGVLDAVLEEDDAKDARAIAIHGEDAPGSSAERAFDVQLALHEALEALAPEGYSFGSHEGDGSLVGFWADEEDEEGEPEHAHAQEGSARG